MGFVGIFWGLDPVLEPLALHPGYHQRPGVREPARAADDRAAVGGRVRGNHGRGVVRRPLQQSRTALGSVRADRRDGFSRVGGASAGRIPRKPLPQPSTVSAVY